MNNVGDRRTMTKNWNGREQDEFFESCSRISSVGPIDFPTSDGSSESEDNEFNDSRLSFASNLNSDSFRRVSTSRQYDFWTSEPGSITERRKRLLKGMGLCSNKELLRLASDGYNHAISNVSVSPIVIESSQASDKAASEAPMGPSEVTRSRSDGDIGAFSVETERRKGFFGDASKQRLSRTYSTAGACGRPCRVKHKVRSMRRGCTGGEGMPRMPSNDAVIGSFFLIKNLDTGKEFIVNESDQNGMWNRLSDLQTGKQLTMEEFEKSVGYSPVVKELMRRENSNATEGPEDRKSVPADSYLSKSFRYSKRRGVALLKNIKGVANSMSGLIADKDRENGSVLDPKMSKNMSSGSSRWTKVRQNGKSHKELSALHLCQEIHAHEGSIWTIRFSSDSRFLASAGEDRLIHVWEVQESEVTSGKLTDDWNSANSSPLHPASCGNSPERSILSEAASIADTNKKKKRGKNRKGSVIPDYVYEPETVFSLSEKPACTFKGHLDDVLDLSWSKSQLLLSSSMDKTVRLWDMETKSCLKLFAHNDYVTCIQFNPMDDGYFISGSLDAKVRLWSIPDRQVVDWTDLHEMVTAVCYTPDGKGALIGSHKGNCRMYSTEDCKLSQTSQFGIQSKKKANPKKITGFQFAPGDNSSEVLITSADSRIRIYDGSDMIHKFRGFRNTSSQISASFSTDGKYVISASEDSQVYVWKRDEPRNMPGKTKSIINTSSHEHFQCRDVSVAVSWPGTIRGEPPPSSSIQSKRHSKRSTASAENISPVKCEDVKKGSNLPPLAPKGKREGEEIGESESFGSDINRENESSLISSGGDSWSFFELGGSNMPQTATSWGMVIVTAGICGEIRAYQNFGLPIRIGRQTNLF